jgi:hypothetical protein
MNDSFSDRLLMALDKFYETAIRFLPGLLAALLIFLFGFVVAWVIKFVIKKALVLARFDRFCTSWGVTAILNRADIRSTPSGFVAMILFWIVLVSFGVASLAALEVKVMDQLVTEFFLYLPRVLSALFIVLVGYFVGSFLSRAALLAAVNASLPSPRGISLIVKLMISILAFSMALEQLAIAKSIVLAAFIITFGSIMFGLAVAFGFGGKEIARQLLERRFDKKNSPQEKDEFSHI